MTLAPERPAAEDPTEIEKEAPASPTSRLFTSRGTWVLGVVLVWLVFWVVFKGQDTLVLPGREHTDLHDSFTGFRDSVLASRDTNPLIGFTGAIADLINAVFEFLQRLFSEPAFPRPVPQVGWLGVSALAVWAAGALAGWRMAALTAATFVAYGLLGFWSDSIDLLLVVVLSVAITTLVGMPLAILMGTSDRARSIITPVLDLLQTMPTFVYLLPIVLFFGIGVSGAVVCTLLYALPPIARIAGHGIRSVSGTTIEATDSYGQTSAQRLLKVQLPMARKTIIVGLNQTTMAALSMATIASYVDGPGLGKPVLEALVKNDVGASFVPGLLIVLTAIMLDRVTTAASGHREALVRAGVDEKRRRLVLIAGAVGALVIVYLSRLFFWAAEFPETTLGTSLANLADDVFRWVADTFSPFTTGIRNVISEGILNPMQSLLAESPWWLAFAAIVAIGAVLGRLTGTMAAVVCLVGIRLLDLWNDAMVTLTTTLVATLLVMVLAVVFGVWMARSKRVDLGLRPLLDAGQTIPAFVYLIPVLALFGPSRFTAIVAAMVYAAPAAIKLVADGVANIAPTSLEAARANGATAWQEITKVQLPMAKGSLVLAANQGLLYVLAMVVIGGLVGAGALGYDVVLGFSRSEEWGKGAAAGLTIVLLGIMLDRIARASAEYDPSEARLSRAKLAANRPTGI